MAKDEETGVHDAKTTNTEPLVRAPAASPNTLNPSEILAPSFAQEDQEKVANELQEVSVIGPPGYASPDPNTEKGLLVPVEDHPLSGDISEDYGGNVANVSDTVPSSPLTTTAGGEVDEEEMTKADLQKEAKARGLSTSGTKGDLADRIREHDKGQTASTEGEVDEEEMTKEELQKEAEARDLPTSGTKEEIADRIREHDEEQ